MTSHELCESLLTWVQTFNLDCSPESVAELTDGVALSQILRQIAPTFFNTGWYSRIKKEVGDNWRIRVSNLKKVLEGILDFYNDVLGQQICDFKLPDVTKIAERRDLDELGRLLQLVLGCAVNCEHKEEYINVIMGMEESVQHAVMNAIQELMSKEIPSNEPPPEAYAEIERQLKRTMDDLQHALMDKEEVMQRCHELDLQVASLTEERNTLHGENEQLHERLDQGDSVDDPSKKVAMPTEPKSTPAGRRHQHLQQTVEELQEENFRLENLRDDMQIRMDMLEREVVEISQKNEKLTSLAEEARALKDEMDELRHTSDKVAKYESTIETYKKKLEDLSDLKRQVKLLEDKNTMYMENSMELEEELKKASALKSQLENYKRQVHELHAKVSEETRRADRADFELQRHSEKVLQCQAEIERLRMERDSLRETNEELTCNQLAGNVNMGMSPGSPGSPLSASFADMMPSEIREKIIRLQHENKMLKLKQGETTDEKTQLLQSLLDDADARKNELESENRIANQRILSLEAEVEELKLQQREEGVSSSVVGESAQKKSNENQDLRLKLSEHKEKLRETDTELQRNRSYIDELEPKYTASTERASNLQEMLKKKEEDMRAMEERYKKYLEKAKSVIRTLDPKQSPASSNEIQLLKAQLHEKQKIIEHLEHEREKSKVMRDSEEKLIVSAWYNMGMHMHRKAAEDRLANSSTGQSFLARQRQASNRRSQAIISGHSSNATR
ncbi:protein Hook homolog 3-like isoform X2 [Acanthaster planci]|uniref:Protein Hook homolog 3-like isoform X2 n=1 Tax=Acanthaster planci TaxID=133434 RepID=A0A8B7Y2B0_ACAPL|nr:protein Hook homolog 3-like isoform X2 [Acanthaster planci]